MGPPGVGKSHLAIAKRIQAVNAGFKKYFVNAGTLVEGLRNGNMNGVLEKKLKALGKYDVLIIDEIRWGIFHSIVKVIPKSLN